MTKIARFKTLDSGQDFTKILKDKELLIYEDVQGAKIYVRYTKGEIIIKPKSLKADPINIIDLAMQKFYNQAYVFFNSLPQFVLELLNQSWWFCFEYFPSNQPANIEYSRTPKNNLLLTSIVKKNKYTYDYDEINEYANLFEVDALPVLFKGKLNEKQLEVIELYLNTKEEDLNYIFNEDNFARFFYKILNPQLQNSFLMDNTFNDNLEKIVIKIDGNIKYSFEILNPLYSRMEFQNNSEYVEIYSLILLKFLEFIQIVDIDNIKIKKITREELYIELISSIFNRFMKHGENYLQNWDFVIPKFFKEDKFKINTDLISDDETIHYIQSSDKLEYIYKCILGSFQKKKKKPVGVFTEVTLNLFNALVVRLSKYIDKKLKINNEYELQKTDLINFRDYFKLKYETDGDGDFYPDVYDEFYDEESGDKKKKKKNMGKKKGFVDGDDFLDDFDVKDEKL